MLINPHPAFESEDDFVPEADASVLTGVSALDELVDFEELPEDEPEEGFELPEEELLPEEDPEEGLELLEELPELLLLELLPEELLELLELPELLEDVPLLSYGHTPPGCWWAGFPW